MTESTFNGLPVNQITRGVITSVFGKAATTKALKNALGTAWLANSLKGLPAKTSCLYYFDRGTKAQTFQLCFAPTNMLMLKQALMDSTASGSA